MANVPMTPEQRHERVLRAYGELCRDLARPNKPEPWWLCHVDLLPLAMCAIAVIGALVASLR